MTDVISDVITEIIFDIIQEVIGTNPGQTGPTLPLVPPPPILPGGSFSKSFSASFSGGFGT